MENTADKMDGDRLASEVLLKTLTEGLVHYSDYAFKHAAVITVVLGWILSSQVAQQLLASSLQIRLGATVCLVAFGFCLAPWLLAWRYRSEAAFKSLRSLSFVDARHFASFRLSRRIVDLTVVLCEILVAAIIFIIWLLPSPSRAAAEMEPASTYSTIHSETISTQSSDEAQDRYAVSPPPQP